MPGLRLFDDVKQRTAGCVGICLVAGLILLSFAGAMAVAQTGAQAASSLNALMPLPATEAFALYRSAMPPVVQRWLPVRPSASHCAMAV